jgi:addiction module HigA family antidote
MTKKAAKQRPIHPGAFLKDTVLPMLEISQGALADLLQVSRLTVSQLMNEHRSVSPEMAVRLERLLGVKAEFWLDMQQALDLWDVRQRADEFAGIKPIKWPGLPPAD